MSTESNHILVVEDDPPFAHLLQFVLEDAGYRVDVAFTGSDALELLDGSPFDLLLTDYGLPDMTGVELCQQMRDDARFASLPVIMFTGFSDVLDTEELLRELALVVLPKPDSPAAMLQTVRGALGNALVSP